MRGARRSEGRDEDDVAYRGLLRSQRNDLLPLIERSGLDAREFGWRREPDGAAPDDEIDCLVHAPTGYFFRFRSRTGSGAGEDGHVATFSPGLDLPEETLFAGGWPGELVCFSGWLEYVRRELSAPTLWEQLRGGEPLLDVAGLEIGYDTPFSAAERDALSAGLAEVRTYLAAELTLDALGVVGPRVDRLEAAASTLGRQSWGFTTVGLFTTLVWAGLMTAEQARAVWRLIAGAFAPLLEPALPPAIWASPARASRK